MSRADPHLADGELVLRPERGFAYQADLTPRAYADDYAAKFDAYDRAIEAKVNAGRRALVSRHLPRFATVLDYGCGNASFVLSSRRWCYPVKGFEVIPRTVAGLKAHGLYAEDVEAFDAVCAWDVLEHLVKPQALLQRVRAMLFVSLPIFEDLAKIRDSKHYRPGEHLFYFTDAGFVAFAAEHGFALLERSGHEIEAGREQVGAYAFVRSLYARAHALHPH